LLNRSKEGKCAGQSSSKWERLTPDDHEENPERAIDIEANAMICKICEDEIDRSDRTYPRNTRNCGHRFHYACISHKSRKRGYDCPLCQGEDEIVRARRELVQQDCKNFGICFLLYVVCYIGVWGALKLAQL
jgi:hypothetical protein